MSHKLLIQRSIDEEMVEFFFNNEHICTTTHDSDGWTGMSNMEKALVRLATAVDADIETEYVEY